MAGHSTTRWRRPAPGVRMWQVIVLLLVCIGGLGTCSTPAAAHASLVAAVPIPEQVLSSRPSEVRLTFTEAVDTRIGGVEVLGPDGRRVDIGRINRAEQGATLIVPIDAEAEGTHTVSWRVVSTDGHTVSGAYVFHVIRRTGTGPIGEATDWPTVILEWSGRALALGGLIFLLGSLWIAGSSARAAPVPARSTIALLVGSLLVLWARGADAGGVPIWRAASSVGSLVGETWAGRIDLVRIALAAAAVVVARADRTRVLAAIGVAALATFPLAGHAWSTDPRALAVAADATHLAAVSVWVGGLVTMLILLRQSGGEDGVALVRLASRRFVIAAPVVVVTGVVSTSLHVGSFSDLTATTWGRTVLLKVAVAVVALALGAVHRRRLAAWVAEGLVRAATLRVEAAVLVVAVGVSAALVTMVPAEVALDRPFSERRATPSGFVQLDVSPARSGSNDVHLAFLSSGSLDRPVDALRVEIATGDLEPRVIPVRLDGASHASAMAVSFGPPGTWRVTVRTVYRGTAETSVFEVELR